jgi:DNA primase
MQTSVLQQMMLDRVAEMTGLTIEQLDTIANLHSKVETIAPEPIARSKPTYQSESIPDYDSGEYQHPRYFESESSYSDSHSAQTSGAVRTGMSAKINLVNSAISILLHRPDLAHQVVSASELEGLYVENISLLQQLLNYLQTTPDASLGTLLLDWQRDPEMAPNLLMLNEISQVDPVLDNVDAKVLLDDAMSRLLSRKYEHELAELTRLSRERPLTNEEKQQLAQLLVRKAL